MQKTLLQLKLWKLGIKLKHLLVAPFSRITPNKIKTVLMKRLIDSY